ncbi:MAG: SUMF1/EgtB/PvdO family nonheme iron enzyme [Thiotrichaceae bacterium]
MIKLSDGAFTMKRRASSTYQDELPPHEVRLQSFSISRFEITFEEFDLFAESTGWLCRKIRVGDVETTRY